MYPSKLIIYRCRFLPEPGFWTPAATTVFHVPYLCYLKDINEIGACRVCVVEVKGIHHLVTSCNNQVQEGMEILTNSPRVREARKINVELLLSQHHTNCPHLCAQFQL